jgi:hypothetical protein
MIRKTAMIAAAAALVAGGAVVAVGVAGDVAACDGKTKTASAQASVCTQSASAAKVSAATAGTSCDSQAKTASVQASTCTRSASAAKVSAATAGTTCGTKTKTASVAGTCSKTASAKSACCASTAKQAHYAQVKKAADNIPYRVNTRLVMSGTYVCGSCNLSVTDQCQAFLKTSDGLYPLTHNSNVKAMHDMHKSGENDFEVTARVTKEGGAKYLDVTYYAAM